MKYWFKPNAFRTDESYLNSSGKLKTGKIKKDTFEKAKKIASYISIQTNLSSLRPFWTTINTFGWIFCDFQPERTGSSLISNGAKRLADLVKEDFKYILLTTKIGDNVIILPEKEILIVNIVFFKEFIKTFSNPEKRVELFLYKLPDNELEIIKRWIRGRPEKYQKDKTVITSDVLSFINENKEFFSQGNTEMTLNLIKKHHIIKNHQKMKEELNNFKKLIDKNALELDINKFLVERPWIISFDYSSLESKKDGDIDIHIINKQWSAGRDIVVELKRSGKKTTTNYSNHEVISSETAKAISQCINYLEERKDIFEKGIVILGNESKEAVAKMNKYLHNIDLLTYNEIYERAKRVLEFLESQYIANNLVLEEQNETTN